LLKYISKEKYNTLSLSLPAYGTKYKNKPLNFDTFPFFLQDELKQFNLRPPYILVGHSLGGYISLEYSLSHKEDVEKLVLISTPLRNSNSKYPISWKILLNLGVKTKSLESVVQRLINSESSLVKLFINKVISIDSSFLKRSDLKSVCLCCLDLGKRDWKKDVEKIDIPTLLVYGTEDKAIKGINGTELYKGFKNKEIISFPCNHSIPVHYPKTLAKKIVEFVEEN